MLYLQFTLYFVDLGYYLVMEEQKSADHNFIEMEILLT